MNRFKPTAFSKPLDPARNILTQSQLVLDPFDEEDQLFFDEYSSHETSELLSKDVDITVIRERAEGIRRIQHSVQEAGQIFKVFTELVTQQGESIDTIESNIQFSLDNTQAAVAEIEKASRWQRSMKARRVKCAILFGAFLLAVIFMYGSALLPVSNDSPTVEAELVNPDGSVYHSPTANRPFIGATSVPEDVLPADPGSLNLRGSGFVAQPSIIVSEPSGDEGISVSDSSSSEAGDAFKGGEVILSEENPEPVGSFVEISREA